MCGCNKRRVVVPPPPQQVTQPTVDTVDAPTTNEPAPTSQDALAAGAQPST